MVNFAEKNLNIISVGSKIVKLTQLAGAAAELSKLRLASLVVLSAIFGYLIANSEFNFSSFIGLLMGGTLVTAGANAFNQIIERATDAVMLRTMKRPLPQNRLSTQAAVCISIALTLGGFLILYWQTNPYCALLSVLSSAVYVFVYTPLKKKTPLAVIVGAIPGAAPPLLGWVAVKGFVGLEAVLLFFLQFLWQFPHFWAIAWRLHEDYARAGIYLLPLRGGPSRENAMIVLVYTLLLIPGAVVPYVFGFYGLLSMAGILLLGVGFSLLAYWLVKNPEPKAALYLLYGSFFYLPFMQLLWYLNV